VRHGVAARCLAPPLTNRGVGSGEARPVTLKVQDGEVVQIPARRGWDGGSAFIDWVTFTCHEDSFAIRQQGVTDDEVVTECSYVLDWILGYGVTAQRSGGLFFYHRSYDLGEQYGHVCHGGQKRTVCVNLPGAACAAAKPGWEGRLFYFLSEMAVNPKISRVDLSHDDVEGSVTVDQVRQWYLDGAFDYRGSKPDQHFGGNWDRVNGKGRTYYVGTRESGLMYRAYEKGKELGDKESPWLRHEVEYRAKNGRVIPFDVLLNPGAYLAGAYPCLDFLSAEQSRIKTNQKVAEKTLEKTCDWLTKQCGKHVWFLSELFGGAQQFVDRIGRPFEFPKALNLPTWENVGRCYHHPDLATLTL